MAEINSTFDTSFKTTYNEKDKQEDAKLSIMSKMLSSYVSKSSFICYNKCIDSNNIMFTKYERNCVVACVNNLYYLNEYMFLKFGKLIDDNFKASSAKANNISDLLSERRNNII